MTTSVDEYRATTARQMPERELQENVRQLCKRLNAMFYHPWRSDNSASGFPDCTIVTTDGRLIFAELKRQGRKPTDAQEEWLDALAMAGGCEVYLWWPAHWLDGTIERILTGQEQTA